MEETLKYSKWGARDCVPLNFKYLLHFKRPNEIQIDKILIVKDS
jgi:hypothetical protein